MANRKVVPYAVDVVPAACRIDSARIGGVEEGDALIVWTSVRHDSAHGEEVGCPALLWTVKRVAGNSAHG